MYSARAGHDEDLPCRAVLIILSARVGPRTLAAIERRGTWHWSSALSLGLRALLDCLCGARLIGGAAARHLPDDPRQLIGERHHRNVPPLAREQMPRPARQWVAVAALSVLAQHRLRADHEQAAQTRRAPLGDARQLPALAAGADPWREPEPGRELPAAGEAPRIIADRRLQADGSDGTDPGNLQQQAAQLRLLGALGEPGLEHAQSLLQGEEGGKELTHGRAQLLGQLPPARRCFQFRKPP